MICPSCHHHFWENGLERCPDCQHPLPKLACDKSWKPLGSWKDFMGFDCAGFAMMAETTAAPSAPARMTSVMLPLLIPPMATTGTSTASQISLR